jgi:hypothetical protein
MADVTKAHCNTCLRETNHEIYAKKVVQWTHEDMQGQESYDIVVCRGCDTVRFRQVSSGSEIYDEHGKFIDEVSYFPSAISRQKPQWLGGSSRFRFEQREIASLLNEVYAAIHEDLRVLVSIGIRTILDMVITDKVGDVGSFRQKVSAFEKAGHCMSSEPFGQVRQGFRRELGPSELKFKPPMRDAAGDAARWF